MRFQIFFLFIQIAIYCNITNVKAMIGQQIRVARAMEYPFVGSIMKFVQEKNVVIPKHFCSGALISIRDFLTGEHCLMNENILLLRIMVGSNDLLFGEKYTIQWWTGYTQWAISKNIIPRFRNTDVAVIRLTREIPFVTPAPISFRLSIGYYGSRVTVAGWGKADNEVIPSLLRVANLNVITNSDCENRVARMKGERYAVPTRYLCSAANPFVLLHSEDTGGPLIHDGQIIGVSISSYPLPGRETHREGVNFHLSMEHYPEFINDVKNIT